MWSSSGFRLFLGGTSTGLDEGLWLSRDHLVADGGQQSSPHDVAFGLFEDGRAVDRAPRPGGLLEEEVGLVEAQDLAIRVQVQSLLRTAEAAPLELDAVRFFLARVRVTRLLPLEAQRHQSAIDGGLVRRAVVGLEDLLGNGPVAELLQCGFGRRGHDFGQSEQLFARDGLLRGLVGGHGHVLVLFVSQKSFLHAVHGFQRHAKGFRDGSRTLAFTQTSGDVRTNVVGVNHWHFFSAVCLCLFVCWVVVFLGMGERGGETWTLLGVHTPMQVSACCDQCFHLRYFLSSQDKNDSECCGEPTADRGRAQF
jgi:hypothetical protein